MPRQISAMLYFLTTEYKRSLVIFWSILFSTIVLSLMLSYFLNGNKDIKMVFLLSGPVYLFCAIHAFISVKQTIPFSIKMGASRKNIFISIGLFFIGLALVQTIIVNLFAEVLRFIVQTMDISTFLIIHPAQLLDNSLANRLVIDFALMLFLLSVMFVFGILFYRYGLIGGGSLGAVMAVSFIFAVAKGWMGQWISFFFESINVGLFYWIMLIALGVYLVAWFFVRRITVVRNV